MNKKAFISYSRDSEAVVVSLVEDIEALGHSAWFDKELSGGQQWWEQILKQIRQCDVLIFVLDTHSLQSTACSRELEYAAALNKPVLPVKVSNDISAALLTSTLTRFQIVDYVIADKNNALKLAKSLRTLHAAPELPSPLPAPPEIPLSYIGTLIEKVDSQETLSYELQSALFLELKQAHKEPENRDDVVTLMLRFQQRRDLLASVSEEISIFLEEKPKTRVSNKSKSADPALSLSSRLLSGVIGAVVGSVIGITTMYVAGFESEAVLGWLTGLGCAIAGLMSGRNLRRIATVMVLFLGVALFSAGYDLWNYGYLDELTARAVVLVAPVSVIFGAVLAMVVSKILGNRNASEDVSLHSNS